MKNNDTTRSVPSQMVLGVLVIAMGLLFLLDNLDIIEFHRAISFWPMAFIVFGIVKLFDSRSANSYLIGGLLIAVGVAMLFNRLGLFYISWHTVWPLILIAFGGVVVYRAIAARREGRTFDLAKASGAPGDPQAPSDTVVNATAILGGFERRITTQDFRGGEVSAIVGGCELDMRGASINGEAVLNVFALFGGISIKCPPDWTVVVHGTPILGGFEEKVAAPPPGVNKRLVVTGYAIMGGVEVRN